MGNPGAGRRAKVLGLSDQGGFVLLGPQDTLYIKPLLQDREIKLIYLYIKTNRELRKMRRQKNKFQMKE